MRSTLASAQAGPDKDYKYPFKFDRFQDGNGNGRHEYGTGLDDKQKNDLIEYMKTFWGSTYAK